jgi:hypothetical protein
VTTPAPSIPNLNALADSLDEIRRMYVTVLDLSDRNDITRAAAALRSQSEARARALEEAAKVVDAWGADQLERWIKSDMVSYGKARAWDGKVITSIIRALKSAPKEPT